MGRFRLLDCWMQAVDGTVGEVAVFDVKSENVVSLYLCLQPPFLSKRLLDREATEIKTQVCLVPLYKLLLLMPRHRIRVLLPHI